MALIEVRNLQKKFGAQTVLQNVNLDVCEGDMKVVMGPSGCGKTTLLRCLNRLEEPTAGTIRFRGKNIMDPDVNVRDLRQHIGYVFQNFALYRHLSVLDNVTLGLRKLKKMSRVEAKEKAMFELNRLSMAAQAPQFPGQLSGGQKQRCAIARALAMDPDVLVFDEPTSALDPVMTRDVADLMNRLHSEGVTILCVTHSVPLARQLSDTVVFLDKGTVHAVVAIDMGFQDHPDQKIRAFFEPEEKSDERVVYVSK